MSIDDILAQLDEMNTTLVQITGGEPLLQQNVHALMERLLDTGYQVLIETSGDRDISVCDSRVHRIIDIKTPNSGAADSFLESNYANLTDDDEVKFVITNRDDFDWAIEVVHSQMLLQKVRAVHFSPVMEQAGDQFIDGASKLEPMVLSDWILESNVPVRMHFQVHKYIWPPQTRGV
jgi:7-carboxy-7-deazaguanine synthase